jgi:hypothetical protein
MNDLLYIPSGRTVTVRPDMSENPVRIELPRNKRPAWIALALVSVWGAVGVVGQFHGLARLSTNTGLTLMAILTIATISTYIVIHIGVLAMRSYVTNDTILLFDDHVEFTAWSLFGKTKWSAPLSEYQGVQTRELPAGDPSNDKPYQIIELVHPDKNRTLPLYLEKSRHPSTGVFDKLADRFGLAPSA